MDSQNRIHKITIELQKAFDAQRSGKEGLARVCARRAAGWAIKEYIRAKGIKLDTPGALDHIKYFHNQEDTKKDIRKILLHMTQKMVKDSLEEDSYWPLPDVNLVEEAHWLVENLMGISIPIKD
jgi:hypothetical protein